MNSKSDIKTGTTIEAIASSLRSASLYNPNDVVRPAAILWTDQDGQWKPIIPLLRTIMPELLTFGAYDPEYKTGPAIWLRCVIERALPEVEMPEKAVPIVYLPNISRQTLRAVQECPDELKPLVELQYRGACWTQKNGKDWTVESFLVSEDGGLGLDISRDAATKAAMHLALEEIAKTPIVKLHGKRLEADDFNKLLVEDTTKDLLVWLNDPETTKKKWSKEKWKAFAAQCKAEFKFDPESQGELTGGERLGMREGKWESVWDRFAESPVLYPGIPNLLRKAMPSNNLLTQADSSWPQVNDEQEYLLRLELLKLENSSSIEARKIVQQLEKEHGSRREWVWAKLGQSPLALSLFYLNSLAEKTANPLGGSSLNDMANLYTESAWEADAAVWQALKAVKTNADVQAVTSAIRGLYMEWLDSCALHFQKLATEQSLPGISVQPKIEASSGGLILFVDALRFDIGKHLVKQLQDRGYLVNITTRWAGVPSVTSTTKPAVSPISDKLQGNHTNDDFIPDIADSDQALTTDRFRKQLEEAGYAYISQSDTGDPNTKAWTEFGEFDKKGHSDQSKLAYRIQEQIDLLVERIESLFNKEWKSIRIVTDHGWLLLPGGLPKVDLPKYLTNSKWTRCASIKGSSKVETPTFPWLWNKNVPVAVAPGISCFGAGNEYAHGGISLQECLIPDILIMPSADASSAPVKIKEVRWIGLRCRISLETELPNLKIEIREEVNKSFKKRIGPKSIDANGNVSLVSEDDYEGKPAIIAVLDSSEKVIVKKSTIIGGEE